MRFTLLRSSLFLLVLLATALGAGCQPATPPPDTIVIGTLYTSNPQQPEAAGRRDSEWSFSLCRQPRGGTETRRPKHHRHPP